VIAGIRLGLAVAACAAIAADAVPPVTVRPPDTGVALANPGMGFVFAFYDSSLETYGGKLAPSDTVDDFPGLSTVSLRLPWAVLEPEEGRFEWPLVDIPAQRFFARGRGVGLRFTASETGLAYATPRWVERAGAKGYRFEPERGITPSGRLWEPDFDDPVFLARLDRFLAAAAARYDGAPGIAFVDVGSFGARGDGDTSASTRRPYAMATVLRHIDLHRKHFQKTLLVANAGFAEGGRGDEPLRYAREHGLALRDDGLLAGTGPPAYRHAALADGFWPERPMILETAPYGASKESGAWGDGSPLLQALEDYHASYLSVPWWPRELMEENEELLQRANRRLGYRLQLVEASWPGEVRAGSSFAVSARWRNAGAAPCLPGGHPAVTLKDALGGIVSVAVDPALDVARLPVGAPDKADAVASSVLVLVPAGLDAGVYDVYVSVGSAMGTPRLLLPLEAGDGQKRCRVGSVTITAPPPAAPPAAPEKKHR
jgi:hypothetical protein